MGEQRSQCERRARIYTGEPPSELYIQDPYIMASQAKQIFYAKEDDSSHWYVCMRVPPRGYHELELEKEFVAATLTIPKIEDYVNQSSDDESFVLEMTMKQS